MSGLRQGPGRLEADAHTEFMAIGPSTHDVPLEPSVRRCHSLGHHERARKEELGVSLAGHAMTAAALSEAIVEALGPLRMEFIRGQRRLAERIEARLGASEQKLLEAISSQHSPSSPRELKSLWESEDSCVDITSQRCRLGSLVGKQHTDHSDDLQEIGQISTDRLETRKAAGTHSDGQRHKIKCNDRMQDRHHALRLSPAHQPHMDSSREEPEGGGKGGSGSAAATAAAVTATAAVVAGGDGADIEDRDSPSGGVVVGRTELTEAHYPANPLNANSLPDVVPPRRSRRSLQMDVFRIGSIISRAASIKMINPGSRKPKMIPLDALDAINTNVLLESQGLCGPWSHSCGPSGDSGTSTPSSPKSSSPRVPNSPKKSHMWGGASDVVWTTSGSCSEKDRYLSNPSNQSRSSQKKRAVAPADSDDTSAVDCHHSGKEQLSSHGPSNCAGWRPAASDAASDDTWLVGSHCPETTLTYSRQRSDDQDNSNSDSHRSKAGTRELSVPAYTQQVSAHRASRYWGVGDTSPRDTVAKQMLSMQDQQACDLMLAAAYSLTKTKSGRLKEPVEHKPNSLSLLILFVLKLTGVTTFMWKPTAASPAQSDGAGVPAPATVRRSQHSRLLGRERWCLLLTPSMYRNCIVALTMLSLCFSVQQLAFESTSPHKKLSSILIAFCALIGSISLRNNRIENLVGPHSMPLEKYAAAHNVLGEWSFGSARTLATLLCLWILIVVIRSLPFGNFLSACSHLEGDRDFGQTSVLRLISFAHVSLIFIVLLFCQLHILRCLELMVDSFCFRVFANPSLPTCVVDWNIVQAILRHSAHLLETTFLCIQTSALMSLFFAALEVWEFSSDGPSKKTAGNDVCWSLWVVLLAGHLPYVLLATASLVLFFKAAAVTNKCMRVPALINSVPNWAVDPIDHQRQYVVHYIMNSEAGFYIKGVRLTTFMALKLSYLIGVVIIGLVMRIGFRDGG